MFDFFVMEIVMLVTGGESLTNGMENVTYMQSV